MCSTHSHRPMADLFAWSCAPLICPGSAINTPRELLSTQLEPGTKTPTAELSERGSTWDTDKLRICSHRQKRASALVSHQLKEQTEELGFILYASALWLVYGLLGCRLIGSRRSDWGQEVGGVPHSHRDWAEKHTKSTNFWITWPNLMWKVSDTVESVSLSFWFEGQQLYYSDSLWPLSSTLSPATPGSPFPPETLRKVTVRRPNGKLANGCWRQWSI